jgi:ABC-2 type transport system permease protein
VSDAAFLPATRAVARRHVAQALTTPALLLPPLMAPLVFFATFAGALGGVGERATVDQPGGYTAFAFVWVLLQGAMFTGLFAALALTRDFETGVAARLLVALGDRRAVVAGYVGAAVARVGLTVAVLFTVAVVAGMHVAGGPSHLAGLAAIAVVAALATALWGIGVALRLQSMSAAPLLQVPVFLALFLCPTFVPLDQLDGWLHAVALANPVTWFLEAGRALIGGSTDRVAPAALAAAGLLAATAAWALTGLRRAETLR